MLGGALHLTTKECRLIVAQRNERQPWLGDKNDWCTRRKLYVWQCNPLQQMDAGY